MDACRAARGIVAVKAALLVLLAVNTAYYLFVGTRSEALDSPAWLVLLVSFEAEAGLRERFGGCRTKAVLRGLRILAAVALVVAAVGYAREGEWLDVLNVGLWIAVVALLEFKLRNPGLSKRAARAFAVAAGVLYTALIALAAAWLLRRDWFDAYDAALWLAAFAIVELDLLSREMPQ